MNIDYWLGVTHQIVLPQVEEAQMFHGIDGSTQTIILEEPCRGDLTVQIHLLLE